MSHVVIATKILVPTPQGHIFDRPQLFSRIQDAVNRDKRLILVCAPAGFGKSSLVSSWLKQANDLSAAWLSLDNSDNYVELFLQNLSTALRRLLPNADIPAHIHSMDNMGDSTIRLILTPVVNALVHHGEPLLIVLDDYHVITNQVVHNAIAFLLKYLPVFVQLIITSRVDPPLPLASLRARQQLSEIRMADLRFDDGEIRRFFHEQRLEALPEHVLHTIKSYTEGWPVGIQLASLAATNHSPKEIEALFRETHGNDQLILDYLAEEVFHRLPEAIQRFLLRTSILDRLTAELCQAVLDDGADAPTLSDVLQHNLFLVQLGTGAWYRYHHLFAQFLRKRLSETATSEEITALHIRASRWLIQHAYRYEAISHVIQVEAWNDMLDLLTPVPSLDQISPNILMWRRWLGALPDHVIDSRPDIYLIKLWGEVLIGDIAVAEKGLERTGIVFSEEIQGSLHLLRHHVAMFRGQHALQISEGARALELLSPDKEPLLWAMGALNMGRSQLLYGSMSTLPSLLGQAWQIAESLNEPMIMLLAAGTMGEAAFFSGKLRLATSWLNKVRHLVTHGYTVGVPFWCRVAARVAYEQNDLVQAEQVAKQGLDLVQLTSRFQNASTLYIILIRTYEALGSVDDAAIDRLLARGSKLAQHYGRVRERIELQVCQLRRWLVQGELSRAKRWGAAHPLDSQTPPTFDDHWLVVAHVYLTRALLDEHDDVGRVAAVEQILTTSIAATAEAGRVGEYIQLLTLQALLLWDTGRSDAATVSLSTALVRAEAEGYLRTFLDEGPALLPLLEQPNVAHAAPTLVTQLYTALALPRTSAPAAPPSIDPLSAREYEILQLLAVGYSTQALATLLTISLHTARTHIRNIYNKLDAHTRHQALAQARSRGLL